jgi:hypothetical protein
MDAKLCSSAYFHLLVKAYAGLKLSLYFLKLLCFEVEWMHSAALLIIASVIVSGEEILDSLTMSVIIFFPNPVF